MPQTRPLEHESQKRRRAIFSGESEVILGRSAFVLLCDVIVPEIRIIVSTKRMQKY